MKRLTTEGKIVFGAIAIIAIILIVVSIILIIPNSKSKPTSDNTKYTTKALSVMKEQNLYDEISKKDYSKTIEILAEEDELMSDYIDEYYKIEYIEIDNFSNTTNELLNKNYTSEEINYIYNSFQDNLDILLNMKHVDILKFKDISNFDINNLERYIDYLNNNDYEVKDAVTYVNIGLDLKGYSKYDEYTEKEAQNDITILVNKYHKLPDNYEPNDLVSLSYNVNYKLRKPAAEAFAKLTSAALIDNVVFYPFSTYRSFKTQEVLYSRYKQRDGEAKADTYSARPGFSEHQLGLAVDVRSSTLSDNLTNDHYKWMLNNSYKYGFIVRYPKGKQYITQFMEEPWHIRYLGVDLATKVHDSGLTYDEYYDIYMKDKD